LFFILMFIAFLFTQLRRSDIGLVTALCVFLDRTFLMKFLRIFHETSLRKSFYIIIFVVRYCETI
jgi:hypothetical protein